MQREQLADSLKLEAMEILHISDIWNVFSERGTIHPTGSAELDTLIYPDLDVYFEPSKSNTNTIDIFAQTISEITKNPLVSSVRLDKDLHQKRSHLPKGTYLQIKLKHNNKTWKIDIWHFQNTAEMHKKLAETAQFKTQISKDSKLRSLILDVKHVMKKPDGSTPSFSSYFVYQAAVRKSMTNPSQIKEYVIVCLKELRKPIHSDTKTYSESLHK